MGKKDLTLKSYLSDPERYADVYNGSVFRGMQVLDGAQLEEAPAATVRAAGNVALEYDRQVKNIQRRNGAAYRDRPEKGSAGEYLYKIGKTDRIRPVSTLIIYWGSEPWDGPRSLHEILDFGGMAEDMVQELKKLIPEYPLHILDLNETNDYSGFRTPLRTVFELYARRSDKQQFLDYVKEHEECRHLDVETHEVIRQLMGAAKLRSLQHKTKQEEEEQDMWKAIEDLIEDGRQEGRQAGRQEGRQAGEANQIIAIIDSMMEKLHCTLEEACEYAGKTSEEYQQAKALV